MKQDTDERGKIDPIANPFEWEGPTSDGHVPDISQSVPRIPVISDIQLFDLLLQSKKRKNNSGDYGGQV